MFHGKIQKTAEIRQKLPVNFRYSTTKGRLIGSSTTRNFYVWLFFRSDAIPSNRKHPVFRCRFRWYSGNFRYVPVPPPEPAFPYGREHFRCSPVGEKAGAISGGPRSGGNPFPPRAKPPHRPAKFSGAGRGRGDPDTRTAPPPPGPPASPFDPTPSLARQVGYVVRWWRCGLSAGIVVPLGSPSTCTGSVGACARWRGRTSAVECQPVSGLLAWLWSIQT